MAYSPSPPQGRGVGGEALQTIRANPSLKDEVSQECNPCLNGFSQAGVAKLFPEYRSH